MICPVDTESGLPDQMLRFSSFLMLQLVKESRRIAGELGDEDLRATHLTVLACLEQFGAASQKEISDRLRIDASDLVSLLDELERRGFAARRRDEQDRRRYQVDVTPAGRKALRRRLAMAERLNDVLLAPLDADERARLHELLTRVHGYHEARRAAG